MSGTVFVLTIAGLCGVGVLAKVTKSKFLLNTFFLGAVGFLGYLFFGSLFN